MLVAWHTSVRLGRNDRQPRVAVMLRRKDCGEVRKPFGFAGELLRHPGVFLQRMIPPLFRAANFWAAKLGGKSGEFALTPSAPGCSK